jgi:hypothetical protein
MAAGAPCFGDTVTATLQLSAARWRLLNQLNDAGATASNAAALLAAQDATTDDLRWLADNDLVAATVTGRTARLDLSEHLEHDGSPAAVAVKLNARGRRAVRAPQNRLLRRLAGPGTGGLALHTLLADTGTDEQAVAGLGCRGMVAATVSATGAALNAADVALLPAATVTVRLSVKGRTHLPRPTPPALPATTIPAASPAAAVAAVFAEDSKTDVGPGSLYPWGFNGPSVEWHDGNPAGGRTVRITDIDNDLYARIDLSPEQIRALRDALAAGAGGRLDTGDGSITWQPGPDGRDRVQFAGDGLVVLSLTPGQLRAWHTQLAADLAAEDTARATFPGLTGRLADKPRGQSYDVDAPLTLPAGGLSEQQLAASARALRLYRSGTYRAVAAHLRGAADPDETIVVRELPGDPGQQERLREHVAAIDRALAAAPLTAPITVWRGLRQLGEHTAADLETDPVGITWIERSYPSTSADAEVASIFSDHDVLLRLHVPAGIGAIQLDSRPTEREHTREAEVLLPRGLHMRVIGESEVGIGGGGATFKDGRQQIAAPAQYRVLEVEVTMPTPAQQPGRRSGGRPPLQPDAVAVEWTEPGQERVRGRIVKRTKTTADIEWSTGRVERGVSFKAANLRWLTEDVAPVGPLPRSTEPIRPPNGGEGIDQGLMHFDSALGVLWNALGDDRHLQVDGHALGNLITDLGEGITRRRHDTNHAVAQLRRLRAQIPDSPAARLVDQALDRLDAPPRPVPRLPEQAPEQLRTLIAELNEINLVRRGYDAGIAEAFHETDHVADLAHQWAAGTLSATRFERQLRDLSRRRHESHEGYTEIHAAFDRALQNARQWMRRRPA